MSSTHSPLDAERRLLRISIATTVVFAVLGIGWGWWAGSQVILLDGVYALIGLALGSLSLRASRLIQAGPTPKYPFGREALAPLMVGIQGMVLLGTFGYAAFDAVSVILAGGSETALGPALLYSVITLVAAVGVWWYLRAQAKDSELVQAEATQWAAGWVLSAGMFVGFALGLLIRDTPWGHLAAYIDPVLVLLACAVIIPTPLRMVGQMYSELLEGTPPPEIAEPVHEAVRDTSQEHGLPAPTIRMGKLGRKLYVELDYLVDEGWSIGTADAVRHDLMQRLASPGRMLWINVELHSDPAWDEPLPS